MQKKIEKLEKESSTPKSNTSQIVVKESQNLNITKIESDLKEM